jgi:MFS transporter, DHA1 family, tetracycline resistance protein
MPCERTESWISVSRSPLLIIFLTVFIDLLGFAIVLPLLPRYGDHFQANGLVLGLMMASFSAMQFFFAPLWGRLSDRVGRRPVLLVGLAGSALSYYGFARVTQLGNAGLIYGMSPLFWLFVTRIGAGIAGATISTAQAYIADVTDAKGRGKGMALIGAAFGLGFTFGPLLGAAFVSDDRGLPPSPAPGYVAALLSTAAFFCALFMLPESLKQRGGPSTTAGEPRRPWFDRQSLKAALSRPYIPPILGSMFLATFAFAQFETTISLLNERLGMGARANFFIFAFIGVVLTLAQGFLVRRFIPRLGEFWMSMIGVGLMVVGLLLLAQASTGQSVWWLLLVLPVVVIGFSAASPSLQGLLSLSTPADEQGGILGVGQSASALARILGPALALPLQEWSLALPYWLGAALMLLAWGLVTTLRGAMIRPLSEQSESRPEPSGPSREPSGQIGPQIGPQSDTTGVVSPAGAD